MWWSLVGRGVREGGSCVVREEAGGSGVGAVVAVRVRMVPVKSFCAVWQKEPL